MRKRVGLSLALPALLLLFGGALWAFYVADVSSEDEVSPAQFTSRYNKPLPPPPSLNTPLSRMTPAEYAAGMSLEELRAKSKAREDADIHCEVLGVPKGSVGTLMHRGDQISVYVEEEGVARMSTTFFMKSGSGELSLAGYAPVQVSWTKDADGFHCTPSAPVPSGGPYGVFGQLLNETGAPIPEALVYGCGDLVRTGEDGSFYLTRTLTIACSLDITGTGSQLTVAVPAAEEDVDMGELILRDVPAGVGLGLILGEMAFDEGRPQATLVVLTVLPQSPAHLAGLRPMDEIVVVNGQATPGRHPAELFDVGVGDQVNVILEDGREFLLAALPMEQLYEQSGTAPQDIAEMLESQSGWY
ncbi:MAG: hypothetical protein ACI9VR_000225 [Cognaticolwellia sp.]|jgi:hypothetical protein